jgi:hypothetical protein
MLPSFGPVIDKLISFVPDTNESAPDSSSPGTLRRSVLPRKLLSTHFTFWSASEQRPVVMEFWLPKAAPRPPVFCSYFSSSHWLFRSNPLILRPISPVPMPVSKFGTSALSHWNQWKFRATKVLRIRGREPGPIPESFSPSFADFAEQDFQKTRNVLSSAVTFCQLHRLTLLEASV